MGDVLDAEVGGRELGMADGGNSKDICSVGSWCEWSWPLISVEDAGVGGILRRVILNNDVLIPFF